MKSMNSSKITSFPTKGAIKSCFSSIKPELPSRTRSNLHWISFRRLAPRYVGGHEIQEAGSLPRLSICNPNVEDFLRKRWVGALRLIGWLGLFVRWVRCLAWSQLRGSSKANLFKPSPALRNPSIFGLKNDSMDWPCFPTTSRLRTAS